MKKNYLFPNYFKTIGWVIAFAALVAFIGFIFSFNDVTFKMPALIDQGFFNGFQYFCMAESGMITFIMPIFIVGLVFVGFSKEKIEDEFVKSK